MPISTELQGLLTAITDVTGRDAITQALNTSTLLMDMYNYLVTGTLGNGKPNDPLLLRKIEWNPDPADKIGAFH